MGPDQHICCSKEPSVVHGSQPPRNIAAREAAQRYKSALLLNFLRSGQLDSRRLVGLVGPEFDSTITDRSLNRCNGGVVAVWCVPM